MFTIRVTIFYKFSFRLFPLLIFIVDGCCLDYGKKSRNCESNVFFFSFLVIKLNDRIFYLLLPLFIDKFPEHTNPNEILEDGFNNIKTCSYIYNQSFK